MSQSNSGPLHRFLAEDHARLDALLSRSLASEEETGAVDEVAYEQFRAGLLRHIGMEEKILLPGARKKNGGENLPIAHQLRLDHGALAALLVPTPTRAIIEQLQFILDAHNRLEEEPGGLYETCERLAADEMDSLLARLQAAPEVPLAPHFNGPRAFEGIERLVAAAGRKRPA